MNISARPITLSLGLPLNMAVCVHRTEHSLCIGCWHYSVPTTMPTDYRARAGIHSSKPVFSIRCSISYTIYYPSYTIRQGALVNKMCRFQALIHVIIIHLPIISNAKNVHISGLFIGHLPIKTRLLTP